MAEHHRRGDAQRVAQFGDVIGHLFQGAGGQRRSAGPPLPAKIDEDQLCRGGQGVQAGRRYPWSNPGPPGSTTMVGYSASRPSPARSCDPATSTYSSAPERLTRITYLHVHVCARRAGILGYTMRAGAEKFDPGAHHGRIMKDMTGDGCCCATSPTPAPTSRSPGCAACRSAPCAAVG